MRWAALTDRRGVVVSTLGITQTLAWGSTYYLPAVFADHTATNLVFAGGLLALAFASGPAGLMLAWTILGIGMGFGLYEAPFATVAGLYGRDARNAITGITLFAGFASTVGWPMSAIFIDTLAGAMPARRGPHCIF